MPRKTASLERLMNRAFTQALFQGRQDLKPLDILLSIFAEKRSYSAYLLKKHKVNKEDISDMVLIFYLVNMILKMIQDK